MRMVLFITVFSLLYGGLHFYAYLKARQALSLGAGTQTAVALSMVLMIFTPIIVRVLERQGFEQIPRVMAYLGYSWMGLLFLFVSDRFEI